MLDSDSSGQRLGGNSAGLSFGTRPNRPHVWTIEAAFATVPPAQSHHDVIFFFRSGEQKIVNGGAPRGRVRATVTISGTSKQALHTGKRSLKLGQTLS